MANIVEVYNMQYPVDFIGIKQGFTSSHRGIDFGWNLLYGGTNANIYAVADGIVLSIQNQYTGGNVLLIKHDNGLISEYGHLKDNSIRVKVGEKVSRGQWVANMGNTGYYKDNGKWVRVPYHLHFGLYKGTTLNYNVDKFVNPLDYLEVYSNQTVSVKTKKEYGSKIKYHSTDIIKYVYNVDDEGLVVHKAPNEKATNKLLKAGTEVHVAEEQGRWSKIGNNEWVYSAYLSDTKPNVKVVTGVTDPPLIVHNAPSLKAKQVGSLYNGDTLEVYKTKKVGTINWAKVSREEERWTSNRYLK